MLQNQNFKNESQYNYTIDFKKINKKGNKKNESKSNWEWIGYSHKTDVRRFFETGKPVGINIFIHILLLYG